MVEEASLLLRELSLPWADGEKVKSAVGRAARLARLAYWRTFDLWYRKAHRVEEYELDQIREAVRLKNEQAAQRELSDLRNRLAVLQARLDAGDADFYRPTIDVVRQTLRGRR